MGAPLSIMAGYLAAVSQSGLTPDRPVVVDSFLEDAAEVDGD